MACKNMCFPQTQMGASCARRSCGAAGRFYRKIKQLTGQTPNDFLRIYRLNRSAELIREGQFPLNEIAEMTGFGTHSHFSTCFKKHFGISPRNFK